MLISLVLKLFALPHRFQSTEKFKALDDLVEGAKEDAGLVWHLLPNFCMQDIYSLDGTAHSASSCPDGFTSRKLKMQEIGGVKNQINGLSS